MKVYTDIRTYTDRHVWALIMSRYLCSRSFLLSSLSDDRSVLLLRDEHFFLFPKCRSRFSPVVRTREVRYNTYSTRTDLFVGAW